MASRTVAKSAIPITNPNLVKPAADAVTKDGSTESGSTTEASPTQAQTAPVNHPSSTVAPIAVAPRLTVARPTTNNWNSLDMGGVNIKVIPPTSGLFSFTFLTTLYLNHNALNTVPAEISKLRHLELLDLSGNNLTTVPPELGMCTQLKELFVFDNQLQTIPPELGSLHQLRTLGIEGNPIEPSLKAIIQKDGTPALISFLRDSCPVPASPPERTWQHLISQVERDALATDPSAETLSALSYNILCEKYATERLYGYTPSWALSWDYRKSLILNEIMSYDADFLCLQEVDTTQYEDYFIKNLADHDYEGVFWPKSRYKTMSDPERRLVDGCATFYKASKYQLVEKQLIEFATLAMQRPDFKKTEDMFNRVLGKDQIAVICSLENKETGTRIIVANAHIHWDPAYCDVKLVQVALLVEEIERIAANFAKYPPRLLAPQVKAPTYANGSQIPVIICVDANSVPESGVYEFMANGSLPAGHPDFLSHQYGRYTSEGLRHRLGLKSAYAGTGHHPLTNYTPSFQGSIDYIWHSAATLAVTAVLSEVDQSYVQKVVGFPNAHFPSDHTSIVSEFRVKPPREPPRQTPVFQ